MNQKIDNFCNELRTKINDTDKRLKDVTARAKNASQKAIDEAQAHLDWLESKAKGQQARVEAAKAKVKAWAQEKKAITSAKIAEWKSQRQVKKLTDRADGAESYAVAAFDVAPRSTKPKGLPLKPSWREWTRTLSRHQLRPGSSE
jgi:DNA repair exonuclease SbcCD ATPase subunit